MSAYVAGSGALAALNLLEARLRTLYPRSWWPPDSGELSLGYGLALEDIQHEIDKMKGELGE